MSRASFSAICLGLLCAGSSGLKIAMTPLVDDMFEGACSKGIKMMQEQATDMTNEKVEKQDVEGFCADFKKLALDHDELESALEDLALKWMMRKAEPMPDDL